MRVYVFATNKVQAVQCVINGQYRETADEFAKESNPHKRVYLVTVEEQKKKQEKSNEHILD